MHCGKIHTAVNQSWPGGLVIIILWDGALVFRSPLPWGSSLQKKFRILETLNLLTDAESSTDTTVECTKNTQNQKKIKTEKIIQNR